MGVVRTGCVVLLAVTVGFWSPAGEASLAAAQAFSSGSTGSDGALNLGTACSSPYPADPASCYVQLPPNGVLNYTTVTIPFGKTLKFKKNSLNTPAILLAQGPVTVAGSIQVRNGGYAYPTINNFDESLPGPGGFAGGPNGQPGLGPGGGQVTGGNARHGQWVGPLSLIPIIGGAGGAGYYCSRGGGGGGALAIASSASIAVSGTIDAQSNGAPGCVSAVDLGSGGAIRLVANSVTVGGFLIAGGNTGLSVNDGVIRLEAGPGAVSVSGYVYPPAVIAEFNPGVVPTAIPSLSIVSVGGYSVPTYTGQRIDMADVLLPRQMPDPINVVIVASNIPVGTAVDLKFGTGNAGSVTPGVLAGSTASSTATVSVSGLNRTQLAYLFVSASFSVAQGAAAGNPAGPNQVAQVKASAPPGGATQFAFFRNDGTRINDRDVPPTILQQYRR